MGNIVTTAIENIETYLESFTEFAKRASGNHLPWLKKLREDAFARFCGTGFPTTHDEDWRFTNISAIARTSFKLADKSGPRPSESDLSPWRLEGAAAQLVFVDGQFVRELSRFRTLPSNIMVAGLKEEIEKNAQTLEAHLGRYLNIQRDPFSALNTAFAEDGAFVHVGRGVTLEAPIHVLFVSTAADVPRMVHPRNLLIFGQESQATVIEEYVSLGGGTVLCNTATELIAGENATVSHYMLEREHGKAFNISTLRIQQERSANVSSHSLLLGGSLVRNNVHPGACRRRRRVPD